MRGVNVSEQLETLSSHHKTRTYCPLASWTLVETQTERVSANKSGGAGARQPSHHHRFGGSSATLLLNKVISSRCTMGTSRMTSVRPSWSRGKMTTFNAGLSAWKLNQRSAINRGRSSEGKGLGEPQETLGSVSSTHASDST